MIKTAIIRKLPNGKYQVQSHTGKNLGTYPTRSQAVERLKEVEMFKHMKKKASDDSIDMSDIGDLSYSAVMRKFRASGNDELFTLFRLLFKSVFDSVFPALKGKSEEKALRSTLGLLGKKFKFEGIPESDKSSADGVEDPAIPRFAKVTEQLYRGGAPATPEDLIHLSKLGIKKIVSLDLATAKKIAPFVKKLGMTHVIIPIMAKKQSSLRGLSKLDFKSLFEDGGPTFVHCLHGKDRTGLVVALYQVSNGMSPEDAIAEADTFDFCTGLPKSVRELYEKMIRAMAEEDSNSAMEMLWPDSVADYKFDTNYEMNDPSFGVRLYEGAEVNPYGMGDASYGSHWDFVNSSASTRNQNGQGTDTDPKADIIPKKVPGGIEPDDVPQVGISDGVNTNGFGWGTSGPIGGGFV